MRTQAFSRLSSPAASPATLSVAFAPSSEGDQHSCASSRRFQRHTVGGVVSGWFSPFGHSLRQAVCAFLLQHKSTSLCSLRSTPITELQRYYGHSDSCVAGSSRPVPMSLRLSSSTQVSLFHAHPRPDHSVVNHPLPPGHRFNTLPLSATGFRSFSERSGLRPCTAGSSRSAGRITFVILRTDRSPPVAPHPVSRRRSYLWLQAGERRPEEDFHLSVGVRSQAHIGVGRTDWFQPLPPPNRTGGSPASGSPVGGSPRQGLTVARVGRFQIKQPKRVKVSILATFDPCFQGRQHSWCPHRTFHPRPAVVDFSVLFSPFGHYRRLGCCQFGHHESTFLCSLRSTPVTELQRYYGHSDSCSAGSSRLLPMSLVCDAPRQVSLIHAQSRHDHSVSKHPTWHSHRFHTLPISATASRTRRSRLRHWLAGSPHTPGRIEFVILRTDRSPPAAPHPASRRRSCSRLQAGERMPEEDFHLSDSARFQAH